MKLIPIKTFILLIMGSVLLSFTMNPFEKEADFVGEYDIQMYPIEDGIKREVVLSSNSEGYQKTYLDGCPQSEIKFKWLLSANKLTFYEATTRARTSCDGEFPEWNKDNFDALDPFNFKIMGEDILLLTSEYDTEYSETWRKIK
ncbi:hypothetical protein [Abyssalbus ytuae]|uniref:Uncharacterized protein n=1 Tax=Abyssalbus ytuae TaxID=2926907 RepID=A0A9E7D294_9FLAO|nr:hypothetical protein [Abyssalbus ytuae]UOB16449.1 hypothetical protein MQE35_11955 [Abyssalbus ytuae]